MRLKLVVAAALLLVSAPAALAGNGEAARIARLKKQVQELRGLEFRTDVTVEFRTKEELKVYLKELWQREVPPEEMKADELLLKQLDLIAPDCDLSETMLKMLAENIAGFYEPKTGKLWLITEPQGAPQTGMEDTVVLHELIHALDDQHFDFQAIEKQFENRDDRALAFQGLVEGSATYGMFLPMVTEEGGETVPKTVLFKGMSIAIDASSGLVPNDTPDFIMSMMVYPYASGLDFVSTIAERAHYDAVNRAFHDPPTSTEQILHPEKYLGTRRDEPMERDFPDFASTLGSDWKLVDENTLGELQMRLIFLEWLVNKPTGGIIKALPEEARGFGKTILRYGSRLFPEYDALRVAAGWDGDRYQLLQHKSGQTAFVWWSTWDTIPDAKEFVEAYSSSLSSRRGELMGRGASSTIRRFDRDVLILENVPRAARDAVVERMQRDRAVLY